MIASIALIPALSPAQNPTTIVRAHVRPTLSGTANDRVAIRWYDGRGRHSTVGLELLLEPGFRLVFEERLARIAHDPDDDHVESAYLEDPGRWRVGKQSLPFGRQNLLRTLSLAARVDTHLVIDDLPISIAACDSGSSNVRGVVGRIGRDIGVSFAVGNHFGIGGGTLTAVRLPEDSPPKGRGYRQVYGIDARRSWGSFRVEAEGVWLLQPEAPGDFSERISELRVTTRPPGLRLDVTGSWAREWLARRNYGRFEVAAPVTPYATLEGFAQAGDGMALRLGVTARIKL